VKILILTHAEVTQLLSPAECVEVMSDALASLARGEVHQPLRMIVSPPGSTGDMALMPSYRSGKRAAFAVKTVCVFPDNPARGLDSHQGSVMLFSAETGELLALMNASAITAIRTAAVSAVATRALAREDATELAIVGSGVQARAHIEAMACVRPIKRARVASLRFEQAQIFAREMSSRVPFPIEATQSLEAAVRDADIVVTATTARDPILKREWIAPGTHLNVVGSSIPSTREIDSATMLASSLFVDRRESTLNEGGDFLFAMREGVIGPDHIRAELGEVLIGSHRGRTSADEITLFKSLGLAVEDLASAYYLYGKARESQAGTWVEY
jgi:ornithine cyclodeaminase/alanine dehydrogenase-like protein (mu-crystallin family)